MGRIRARAAVFALLLTFVFTAGAQATGLTSSSITSPADGTLEFQNLDTNPDQTFTVTGSTDGTMGDKVDIDCYSGNTNYHSYTGPGSNPVSGGGGTGVPVNSDGSFSADAVPQQIFATGTCHLVAVPHGTTPSTLTGFTGPRVPFSEFYTSPIGSGANAGALTDYKFDDVTTLASSNIDSIDDCGPYTNLVDGTSAMNVGRILFYCAGSFYNSSSDFGVGNSADLTRSEIQVDGANAYGSSTAASLFNGSDTLAGFPALSASVTGPDPATGDAQTTESEALVKCSPNDAYSPTSADCTSFAPSGVSIRRVTSFSNSGRVATVIDVFSSTDGMAHALDIEYETDLNATTAGWQFPGQSSFTQDSATTNPGPVPSSFPATAYAIYDTTATPSLANPVGAMTFITPYSGATFDNSLWGGEDSTLFDYQLMAPAGGSIPVAFSVATGSTLAEVQGYASEAQQPPTITISSPASGATETSSPVTVSGSASAGSGVRSVTVNGVAATVSGSSWQATVPLTSGQNTLTATLTSDAGSTATATTSVSYAPPATTTTATTTTPTPTPTPTTPASAAVRLISKRAAGTAALVKLACAANGSDCAGRITLTYTKTVVSHHKKHRVKVVVGTKHYAIAKGLTATIRVTLNRTGKRLLKAHRKLLVKGSVGLVGANARIASAGGFRLTLKQPKRK